MLEELRLGEVDWLGHLCLQQEDQQRNRLLFHRWLSRPSFQGLCSISYFSTKWIYWLPLTGFWTAEKHLTVPLLLCTWFRKKRQGYFDNLPDFVWRFPRVSPRSATFCKFACITSTTWSTWILSSFTLSLESATRSCSLVEEDGRSWLFFCEEEDDPLAASLIKSR